MKCEICHKQEAQTVWFRKHEDGKLEELYVCHACAEHERVFGQERGIQVATMEAPEDLPLPQQEVAGPLTPEALGLPREMLGKGMEEAFAQLTEKLQEMGIAAPGVIGSNEACKYCGMPLDEIRMGSRIGCAKCLEQFRATILAMLEETQGCATYAGGDPTLTKKQQLRERLQKDRQKYIELEDYRSAKACDEALKALDAEANAEEAGDDDHA